MTQASWPARLLGLSLCSLGIVAGVGCDGPGSDGPGSGTTTHSGNSSVTAVGNDSATETDDWGEGATYAGPDSWGTTEGDSDWGTTGGDYSGSDGPGSDGPGSDDADAPGSEGG